MVRGIGGITTSSLFQIPSLKVILNKLETLDKMALLTVFYE